MPQISSNTFKVLTSAYLLTASIALTCAQEVAPRSEKVAFRNSQVEIKSIPVSPAEMSSDSSEQGDSESLAQKLKAAQNELNFSKARLEAARKTVDTQTAGQNYEKADVAKIGVKDWEARVKVNEGKVAQIEQEMDSMQGGQSGLGAPTGMQDDLILPGENVELFVVEDSSFNSRYQVRRGGYILLPAVGRVSIAGKAIPDAEKAVRQALEASQLRKATVMIEKIQGNDVEHGPVVYLSGEFANPRPFRIPSGTKPTLVSCILSCGGVTDKADLSQVKVMRVAGNKGVVEEVNVEKILMGGGLGSDLTLDEGDVVILPSTANHLVYMTGNLKNQGSFILNQWDKIGAYTAILRRGGFARFADEKRVYVLRATPDGTKIRIPLDVAAIKKGKTPDIQLQRDDIVVVPEKFFSF